MRLSVSPYALAETGACGVVMTTAATATDNTLYYGDNLDIPQEHIPTAGVDVVSLDPPFNSHRNDTVLFRDESGQDSEARITAFEDTWHGGPDAEAPYDALVTAGNDRVAPMIDAMRSFVGATQMMAYLVMMAALGGAPSGSQALSWLPSPSAPPCRAVTSPVCAVREGHHARSHDLSRRAWGNGRG